MNEVLDILCSDHANFAKLLNVIEQEAETIMSGNPPDMAVLSQAVAYLEGYPTIYHHPLEDAVYWRLRTRQPETAADIADVLYEHSAIRQLLTRLKQAVMKWRPADPTTGAHLADTAFSFIDAQWTHMEHERSGLFPAAVAVFEAADWEQLLSGLPRTLDPLFTGNAAIPPLRELHNKLLVCDTSQQTASALRTHRQAVLGAALLTGETRH